MWHLAARMVLDEVRGYGKIEPAGPVAPRSPVGEELRIFVPASKCAAHPQPAADCWLYVDFAFDNWFQRVPPLIIAQWQRHMQWVSGLQLEAGTNCPRNLDS